MDGNRSAPIVGEGGGPMSAPASNKPKYTATL